MAIWCPDHKLLFLGNPRSASTAIGEYLTRLGGRPLPPGDIMGVHGRPAVRAKHCTLADLMRVGIIPPSWRAKIHTFAVLRDPLEIVVTWYYLQRSQAMETLTDPNNIVHKIPGRADDLRAVLELPFGEWVKAVPGSGRYAPDSFSRCADDVDMVLRYEHLQEDMDDMLYDACGIDPPGTIPLANVTPDRPASRDVYDLQSVVIVRKLYAEHLDRWQRLQGVD